MDSAQTAAQFGDPGEAAEAAALDGNLNHEIRFPRGTVCKDQIELPAKNGANALGNGYIILRPDIPDDQLPPEVRGQLIMSGLLASDSGP